MTDQPVHLERIDRSAALSDDERARLECLHFTRSRVGELGRRTPAFRGALESAATEWSSPPA